MSSTTEPRSYALTGELYIAYVASDDAGRDVREVHPYVYLAKECHRITFETTDDEVRISISETVAPWLLADVLREIIMRAAYAYTKGDGLMSPWSPRIVIERA